MSLKRAFDAISPSASSSSGDDPSYGDYTSTATTSAIPTPSYQPAAPVQPQQLAKKLKLKFGSSKDAQAGGDKLELERRREAFL